MSRSTGRRSLDQRERLLHRGGHQRHRFLLGELGEAAVERLGRDRAVVADLHQGAQEALQVDHGRRGRQRPAAIHLLVHVDAHGSVVEVATDHVRVAERAQVGRGFVGRVPVPTVEHEPDVVAADLGDQFLHLGHSVDERDTARSPGGLGADVLQAEADAAVAKDLGRLAEPPGVLGEVGLVGERLVGGCKPGANPGHARPLEPLGHLRKELHAGRERRLLAAEVQRQARCSPDELLGLEARQEVLKLSVRELGEKADVRFDHSKPNRPASPIVSRGWR